MTYLVNDLGNNIAIRKTVDSRQHLEEFDKARASVISYSSGAMQNKFTAEVKLPLSETVN